MEYMATHFQPRQRSWYRWTRIMAYQHREVVYNLDYLLDIDQWTFLTVAVRNPTTLPTTS